jgi:hypothetical protein
MKRRNIRSFAGLSIFSAVRLMSAKAARVVHVETVHVAGAVMTLRESVEAGKLPAAPASFLRDLTRT